MFIKTITSSLLFLISRLIDKDVMVEVKRLVEVYMNLADVPGPDKKRMVTEILTHVTHELSENIVEMSGWLLSTAIDIAHAYLTVRK